MTTAEVLNEKREEFRKIKAEYFELIGDKKAAKEILKESHEKLILTAYLFAILHFQDCIDEVKMNIKRKEVKN